MLYAGFFEGLVPRDLIACMRCGRKTERGDRVRPVFLVGGIFPSPTGAGRILVLAANRRNVIQNEFIHVNCTDTKCNEIALIEKPSKKYGAVMSADQFREISPRGEPYKCVRCKKDFEREDRVFSMHIVLGTGFNPEAGTNVTACSGNYEMTHCDCNDPKLSGGIIAIAS